MAVVGESWRLLLSLTVELIDGASVPGISQRGKDKLFALRTFAFEDQLAFMLG